VERHRRAEAFQPAERACDHALLLPHHKKVGPEVAGQAMVLGREIMVFPVGRHLHDLSQHGFEPRVALSGSPAQAYASALAVA
jgi:hypothetical protein